VSNKRISTVVSGKRTSVNSELEQFDFQSLRVGANKLAISEFDSNSLTLNGKRMKVADAVESAEAVSKTQLDDVDATLQAQLDILNGNNPVEELITVGAGGATIFNASLFSFSPLNTDLDAEVYVNGVYQTIDQAGGLDKDWRKNSSSQIEFSYLIPEGAKVGIRLQGTSSGVGGGEANSMSNVGTGAGVYKEKLGVEFKLKTIKGGSGVTVTDDANELVLSSTLGSNLMVKSMQNLSGSDIAAGSPISKKSDGSIMQADSDGLGSQSFVGIALAPILDGNLGNIALVGANISGAISGLGFAPGKDIYLSETGSYTDDAGSFTGSNDSVIKVGVSDCPDGVVSSTATDIIMFSEVILRS